MTLIKSLNAELNPICHFLALFRDHHILHVSRVRLKEWVSLRQFLRSSQSLNKMLQTVPVLNIQIGARTQSIRKGDILITLKNEAAMSCPVPIFRKLKTLTQRMDTFCTKFYKNGSRSVEITGRGTTCTLRKVRLSMRRFLANSCLLLNILQAATTLRLMKI